VWVCALLCLVAATAGAGDLVLPPGFSPRDLADLAAIVADSVAFPQLAEAGSLGLTGFHVVVAAGGPQVLTRADWWNSDMKERVVGGVLTAPRLLARKGLPKHLDAGIQVGKVFGHRFWGGEVAWGLVEGGALLPAVSLAGSYCRLENAPLALEIAEARLAVSKGFAILTPFASLGYRRERASATLAAPFAGAFAVTEDRVTGIAGLMVGVPPLRFVAEVRRAAATGFFVGVGVGL